jgi:simple sugar transport system ATP-binding protein
VSFTVRAGEVVGIAGVEGNGQKELVRILSGLEAADAGRVRVEGGARVAVVHEDRHREGLVLDASVGDNTLLGELAAFAPFGLVDLGAMQREAQRRLVSAGVVPADADAPARSLSGGNQQKVVMARAVARTERGPSVLVLAHPTRGVDLGATRAIHARVARAAAEGHAVVVVSADLHELRALSDRILVMARGRIVAELDPGASDARIGEAMLGAGS